MAAELGSHHAFFPLSRRHSQGDLYDQQRGGTASLAAQDHQNAGSFSPRGVSAEVAISGDPPGVQEVDHAGDQLEPSLELLHRALARAHAQAGQVGIMHLSSFLRNPSPKTTATPKTKLGRLHRRLDTTPGDYSYCACSRLYSPFHHQPLHSPL